MDNTYLACQLTMVRNSTIQVPYNNGVCLPRRAVCYCPEMPVHCHINSSLSTNIDDEKTLLKCVDTYCLKYCPKRQKIEEFVPLEEDAERRAIYEKAFRRSNATKLVVNAFAGTICIAAIAAILVILSL